jgi:hypothetical protein
METSVTSFTEEMQTPVRGIGFGALSRTVRSVATLGSQLLDTFLLARAIERAPTVAAQRQLAERFGQQHRAS